MLGENPISLKATSPTIPQVSPATSNGMREAQPSVWVRVGPFFKCRQVVPLQQDAQMFHFCCQDAASPLDERQPLPQKVCEGRIKSGTTKGVASLFYKGGKLRHGMI